MGRREEIAGAAIEALDAGEELTIEAVGRRSGASVGSIYHHFGDKDGIAAAVYVEVLRDYQDGAERVLGAASGAEQGVKGLVRHHLRWVEGNPERARFLLRAAAARAAAGAELERLNRDFSALVTGWVGRHPSLRPLSLEVFYVAVIGPAQEASRLWLAGRIGSLRELEGELAEVAWRATRR